MTTMVEIPGGTALLRESKELRGRDRNLVKAAAMAAADALAKMPEEVQKGKQDDESDEDAAVRLAAAMADVHLTWQESLSLLELRQATVVASLISWSRDEKLPTMETIGDLEADLYDALDTAIGGVSGAVGATDFDPTPNPKDGSPTGDSGPFDMPSMGGPESPSTPTLPSGGESTVSAGSIAG